MAEYFTAGQGGIWMQPDGPGTEMVFLGCHQIDSVDAPEGDETPIFCPNPAKTKDWIAVGSSASPPDMISFTIEERMTNALSYLREQSCPFTVYITLTTCGRRNLFENADTVLVYNVQRITGRTLSNPVMLESDEGIMRSYDLSALPPEIEVREVAAVTIASGTSEDLNSVTFCDDEQCADTCGSAVALGQNGLVAASETV